MTHQVFEIVGLYQILDALQGRSSNCIEIDSRYLTRKKMKAQKREAYSVKSIWRGTFSPPSWMGKYRRFKVGSRWILSPCTAHRRRLLRLYPLMNGKIRIVIGDVMGKNIPAAMLMILTRVLSGVLLKVRRVQAITWTQWIKRYTKIWGRWSHLSLYSVLTGIRIQEYSHTQMPAITSLSGWMERRRK